MEEDNDDDALSALMGRFAGITVVDEADLQKQFAAILGISPAEAQFFLAAANNNLAGAINLYLEAVESQRNEQRREPRPAEGGASDTSVFGLSGSGMMSFTAAGSASTSVSDEDELLSAAIAASMGAPVSASVVSTQEYVLGADGRIVGAGRAPAAAVFDFGRVMGTGGPPPEPEGGSSMDQG